jgi:hypothetical protein
MIRSMLICESSFPSSMTYHGDQLIKEHAFILKKNPSIPEMIER